jgi:3-oxoacyl-[acyl-carrier-protein] synthase II
MTAERRCMAMITGIGCVSPFGVGDHNLVAEVLKSSVSALRPVTGFSTAGLSHHLGAEVSPALLPHTEETRRWSRMSLMTVAACQQALTDAGLHGTDLVDDMGLVLGTEYGDLRSTEAFGLGFLRRGPAGLSALLFPNTVMNAMAGTASIALGLKGPLLTLNQPGIAGEIAVARALALLQAGRVPAVIACGVDELFPTLYTTLAELQVLSPRDQGDEACRPFDQRHNGLVLGEGATAMVLESPEFARRRNAPALAEVWSARWGRFPAHPHHYPRPQQAHSRLLDRTLAAAALRPRDVDVAYLSGSGDPCHDAAELALLVAAFGDDSPVLTSVTHLTGEYGGLGVFRVTAAAVTVATGFLPTMEYLDRPLRPDVRFTASGTRPVAPHIVLVHGLARGGAQAAIVLAPSRPMTPADR